ncbi:V-set and immunoglobulin domain-containing protein 1-like [Scyliorhinus torazame]|uniref:Ig-like domain-containing protein n=1 Tax=Scyliorhinus torazame TaxID=75743 RepID=A0A401Q632_SCYTO|nr:hypothetical protein [Scyliorhinus torazame]
MELANPTLVLILFTVMSRAAHLTCRRKDRIEIRSGETVRLPCLFGWHGRHPMEYMVVWQLIGRERDLLVYGWESQSENAELGPRYRNRAGVGQDWFAEGDATLSLSELTPSDGGLYTCKVTTINPHRSEVCAEVILSVQEGPAVGNLSDGHDVRGQQQHLVSSTTGHNPGHGEKSSARNMSVRARSPTRLIFSQLLILLSLIPYGC